MATRPPAPEVPRRLEVRAGVPSLVRDEEMVAFVVRGAGHTAQVPRTLLVAEMSPVLQAMVTEWPEEEPDMDMNGPAPAMPSSQQACLTRPIGALPTVAASDAPPPPLLLRAAGVPRGEQDEQGRYILDGPVNPNAFLAIMEAVRRGGYRPSAEGAAEALPDVEARVEAVRFADYYLLPTQVRMQLTKELLSAFVKLGPPTGESLDVGKLGLCRSEMVMDRIHLEGLLLKGFQLENSHVRRLQVRACQLTDCDINACVTANEVEIAGSRLESVRLGVFASRIAIKDCTHLLSCNLRVVEELIVSNAILEDCTFRGSDEDRKDRQIISAVFRASEIHGDVVLPFDRIVCDQSSFLSSKMRMAKGGASINYQRMRLHSLPSTDGDARLNLCLEDCDITESLRFQHMRLNLRGVRFLKPCEMKDVEFVEKVCDVTFPRRSSFKQVRFRQGLQACIASGCGFEACNLGYGQDAVSDCLLTQCSFQACRFPFLEADSPVANFSRSNFVACQIQWSGQFPHEESFVINSCWLRKWNLAGCTVTDGN